MGGSGGYKGKPKCLGSWLAWKEEDILECLSSHGSWRQKVGLIIQSLPPASFHILSSCVLCELMLAREFWGIFYPWLIIWTGKAEPWGMVPEEWCQKWVGFAPLWPSLCRVSCRILCPTFFFIGFPKTDSNAYVLYKLSFLNLWGFLEFWHGLEGIVQILVPLEGEAKDKCQGLRLCIIL